MYPVNKLNKHTPKKESSLVISQTMQLDSHQNKGTKKNKTYPNTKYQPSQCIHIDSLDVIEFLEQHTKDYKLEELVRKTTSFFFFSFTITYSKHAMIVCTKNMSCSKVCQFYVIILIYQKVLFMEFVIWKMKKKQQ